MTGRVPLARKNLFQDRRRALLAVGGVAASLVLVLVLDGVFAGAMQQVNAYMRNSPADVFVAQRDVRTMHMTQSALPPPPSPPSPPWTAWPGPKGCATPPASSKRPTAVSSPPTSSATTPPPAAADLAASPLAERPDRARFSSTTPPQRNLASRSATPSRSWDRPFRCW